MWETDDNGCKFPGSVTANQKIGNMKLPGRLVGLLVAILMVLAFGSVSVAQAQTCGAHGVAVQVLGSGGPELADKRAMTSYVIWRDGRARILIDAGGGSALRFGESGARMADLDAILFSHFHVDHAATSPR